MKTLPSNKTPHALGFRMPAEWERHEATWLGWPHELTDWPGKFAPIPWAFAEIVRHLWQRWLTHAVIDEFSRVEEIKGQRVRNVLTAAKNRRPMVAPGWISMPVSHRPQCDIQRPSQRWPPRHIGLATVRCHTSAWRPG